MRYSLVIHGQTDRWSNSGVLACPTSFALPHLVIEVLTVIPLILTTTNIRRMASKPNYV